MASLSPIPALQFLKTDGKPCAGYYLHTYAAGTNNLKATYQDSTGTLNSNPIILDTYGSATVFLAAGAYKFILKTSLGATVRTFPVVEEPGLAFAAVLIDDEGAKQIGFDDTTVYGALSQLRGNLLSSLEISGGATPDSITDWHDGFVEAEAFLKAQGGGTFYLSPGTYKHALPWQIKAATGMHIVGAGVGAVILKRTTNFAAPSLRFYMGQNNSMSNFTLDCDGYEGRGIYIQDFRTFVRGVAVLNCPNRPFGLNGGGNASYGLDYVGRTEDDASFTTAEFYPMQCGIVGENYAYNSGQTAFSQKRMRYSTISHNICSQVYSEGLTMDVHCDSSTAVGNVLINTARTDGATVFPDKVAGSGYIATGGGGTGAIGIDFNSGSTIAYNQAIGVQQNIATVNDRTKSAINFQNNAGPSYACKIVNNHVEDAKCGVKIVSGTGGSSFKCIVNQNTFQTIGDGVGAGSAEYGDIWIGTGQTGHSIKSNKRIGGVLLITDLTGNNDIETESVMTSAVGLLFGGANTGLSASKTVMRYERVGRFIMFDVEIILTNKGSATGAATIGVLPIAADVNAITNLQVVMLNASTAADDPYAYIAPGGTSIILIADKSTTGAGVAMTDANFANNSVLRISGRYAV